MTEIYCLSNDDFDFINQQPVFKNYIKDDLWWIEHCNKYKNQYSGKCEQLRLNLLNHFNSKVKNAIILCKTLNS